MPPFLHTSLVQRPERAFTSQCSPGGRGREEVTLWPAGGRGALLPPRLQTPLQNQLLNPNPGAREASGNHPGVGLRSDVCRSRWPEGTQHPLGRLRVAGQRAPNTISTPGGSSAERTGGQATPALSLSRACRGPRPRGSGGTRATCSCEHFWASNPFLNAPLAEPGSLMRESSRKRMTRRPRALPARLPARRLATSGPRGRLGSRSGSLWPRASRVASSLPHCPAGQRWIPVRL